MQVSEDDIKHVLTSAASARGVYRSSRKPNMPEANRQPHAWSQLKSTIILSSLPATKSGLMPQSLALLKAKTTSTSVLHEDQRNLATYLQYRQSLVVISGTARQSCWLNVFFSSFSWSLYARYGFGCTSELCSGSWKSRTGCQGGCGCWDLSKQTHLESGQDGVDLAPPVRATYCVGTVCTGNWTRVIGKSSKYSWPLNHLSSLSP